MTNEMFFALIILLAAFGTSIWNGLLKSSGDQLLFSSLMVIPQIFISAIFILFLPLPTLGVALILILSAIVHNTYILFLGYAYREGDLSFVFPIAAGTAPLLALVYWYFLFQTSMPTLRIIGVLLLSLSLVGLPFFSPKRHLSKKAILYALGTAVFIALYASTDTYGLRLSSAQPLSYISWLFFIKGMMLLGFVIALRRLKWGDICKQYWRYGLAGVLAALGYAIAMWSFIHLETSVVLALRSTSILFSLGVAIIALKEAFSWARAMLCVSISAGVFLILLK